MGFFGAMLSYPPTEASLYLIANSGVVHPLVLIEDVTEDNKKPSERGDTR